MNMVKELQYIMNGIIGASVSKIDTEFDYDDIITIAKIYSVNFKQKSDKNLAR